MTMDLRCFDSETMPQPNNLCTIRTSNIQSSCVGLVVDKGGGEYDSSKVRRHSGPLVDKAGLGMLEYVSETYYTKGIILWGVQRDELR